MSDIHPPLLRALEELGNRIPAERIDRVWLFPARQPGKQESALAVLSLFDDDPDRREVVTVVTCRVPGDASVGRTTEVTDHGSVPDGRVEPVIDGVLRRLKDEREIPRSELIGGDAARWSALLSASGPA